MADTDPTANFGFTEEIRDAQLANEYGVLTDPDYPAHFSTVARTHYRVWNDEAGWFSPDRSTTGYDQGTAFVDDELLIQRPFGTSPLLLTAEHATDHHRLLPSGVRKVLEADYGTGGLAITMQEATGVALIAALGRQTGDANHDVEHPFKTMMRQLIDEDKLRAHISLHGMDVGHVSAASDERPFHVLLGIGEHPNEATRHLAYRILQVATAYGLRVGINQPTVRFQAGSHIVRQRSDGNVDTITFAASNPGTTRAFAEATAEELGRPDFAAIQMELSGSLRVIPAEYKSYPGLDLQRLGVALGVLLLRDCVDLVKEIA